MRMRSVPFAFVIAAIVAGCAPNPPIPGVEPEAPPPLRVWIGYPIGSGRVHPIFVNRDAHVAMFEIIPGRGVTMVYPTWRGQAVASETHYANLAVQPGRMFYHSDPFGHASFQPRYYYAVASTAPLNLAQLQTSLGATRRVLGRMYASFRPYDVIDRLTELVVPMQADEDWATDIFVDWPVPVMPRFVFDTYVFDTYRAIACANGRVIRVPRNYPYYGCPGDTQPAVVATASPPPVKPTPLDSIKRPRLPGGDTRRPSSGDTPEVEKRRRAEAGAQPPRTHGAARVSAPGEVRLVGDREFGRSTGSTSSTSQPVRSTASDRAPAPSKTEQSRPVERGESRSGESGTARKP